MPTGSRAERRLGDDEAPAHRQEPHGALGRRGRWPERPCGDEIKSATPGWLTRQLLGPPVGDGAPVAELEGANGLLQEFTAATLRVEEHDGSLRKLHRQDKTR